MVKKKLGIKTGGGGGGGRLGGKPPGKPSKIDVLKKKRLPDVHRKRAYKAKVRGMFGAPAVSLQVGTRHTEVVDSFLVVIRVGLWSDVLVV